MREAASRITASRRPDDKAPGVFRRLNLVRIQPAAGVALALKAVSEVVHLLGLAADAGEGAADGLARGGGDLAVLQRPFEAGPDGVLGALDNADHAGVVAHQGVLHVGEGAL